MIIQTSSTAESAGDGSYVGSFTVPEPRSLIRAGRRSIRGRLWNREETATTCSTKPKPRSERPPNFTKIRSFFPTRLMRRRYGSRDREGRVDW